MQVGALAEARLSRPRTTGLLRSDVNRERRMLNRQKRVSGLPAQVGAMWPVDCARTRRLRLIGTGAGEATF